MIGLLGLVPLIVFGIWLRHRMAQMRHASSTKPAAAAPGPDDDGAGLWTALDERQLIRLLTDSAP